MLTPRSRRLLLEALRPPPGHSLSRAIGTSYTLDLMALLTAPLAFTFFDQEDDDGRPIADPLALLQAVRSNANRIHIFCQAGGIAVPSSGRTLLSYLEDSVFEVTAPKEGGVFHPKIWVIRFVSERDEPRYRLICLTRNLTFDRSWDTALVLDGQFVERSRVVGKNAPLSSFLGQLPSLALRPVPASIGEGVQAMSEEIGRVRFELPDGFESYRFWPLGLSTRQQWPFPDPEYARRLLICSPFLSDSFLTKASASRPPAALISRPESLLQLGQTTRANFSEFYVLSPEADPEEEDSGNANSGAEDGVRSDSVDSEELTGLHAKLFVMDDGWNARIWTGSANATDAAFHRNVEFLIELTGKKSFCGIDKLLGDEGGSEASLRDLLQPFHLPDDLEPSDEEALGQLEQLLSQTQLSLARTGIRASVSKSDDGYTVGLSKDGGPTPIPEEMEVRVRPITLPPHWAQLLPIHDGVVAEFPKLSFEALTSFFAFELTLKMDGQELKKGFVLNLPVSGMPADRRDRLLQAILKSSKDVLRLILLLLSDLDITASQWAEVITHRRSDASAGNTVGFPLLETLLRALDRDPTKLDEVSRLVEDLRRTPEGSELIPKGFDSIWDPIWAVRQEISDG